MTDWTPLKVFLALPDSDDFHAVRNVVNKACNRCGCESVEIERSLNRREYWPRFRKGLEGVLMVVADFTGPETPEHPASDVIVEATVAKEMHELPVWVLSGATGDTRPILFRDDRLFVYGSGRRAVLALEDDLVEALRAAVEDYAVGHGLIPPWDQKKPELQQPVAESPKATPASTPDQAARRTTTRRYAKAEKPVSPETEVRIRGGVTQSDVDLLPVESDVLDGFVISAGEVFIPDPNATKGPTIASEPALRPVSLAPRPELLADFEGHEGLVNAVVGHAESGRAMSGGADEHIVLYDLNSLEPIEAVSAHPGGVTGVSANLRGTRIVSTGMDGFARVWDLEAGNAVEESNLRAHPDGARSVIVLPIRSAQLRVVTGGEAGDIIKWNLTRGEPSDHWRAHDGPVFGLSMSNDGARVLSGGEDSQLVLWDVATGKDIILLTRAHVGPITSVALSFNGHVAISAGDDACKLWDLDNGDELNQLDAHRMPVRASAFVPGDRYAITVGADGTAAIWDMNGRKLLTQWDAHDAAIQCVHAVDTRRIMTGGADGLVRVWDITRTLG